MFRTIIRHVRKWQKLDDEIMRLKVLDDYLLADMGIDRRDIPAYVRGRLRR